MIETKGEVAYGHRGTVEGKTGVTNGIKNLARFSGECLHRKGLR